MVESTTILVLYCQIDDENYCINICIGGYVGMLMFNNYLVCIYKIANTMILNRTLFIGFAFVLRLFGIHCQHYVLVLLEHSHKYTRE
jgi:hypothetical protein